MPEQNSTTMADNFLEKQYDSYQEQKSARQQADRKAWQKKLKEYKKKLAAQKAAHDSAPNAGTDTTK